MTKTNITLMKAKLDLKLQPMIVPRSITMSLPTFTDLLENYGDCFSVNKDTNTIYYHDHVVRFDKMKYGDFLVL